MAALAIGASGTMVGSAARHKHRGHSGHAHAHIPEPGLPYERKFAKHQEPVS